MNSVAQRIGILGAGQLGGYLCIAARKLGFETTVLANNADEMAVALADETIFESSAPEADALALAARCDFITFEKEDIAPNVLQVLAAQQAETTLEIAPSVDTMLLLQNKALQKRWLCEQGLPTAAHIEIAPGTPLATLREQMGSPFVVKTERGGYDGLGVRVIRDGDSPDDLGVIPSIAERYIGDRREFAVLVARTASGDVEAYPAVEMVFDPEGNLLRTILAPAPLAEEQLVAAQRLAVAAITALGTAGVFAVELFYSDGELLINEISPRVHNSGHHTMEAAPTSQFEQHIRAITHRPLGSIAPMRPAALINLLCEPALHHVCCSPQQSTEEAPDVFVHWYGKNSLRHLRKMGHLTALGATPEAALAQAQAHLATLEGGALATSSDSVTEASATRE